MTPSIISQYFELEAKTPSSVRKRVSFVWPMVVFAVVTSLLSPLWQDLSTGAVSALALASAFTIFIYYLKPFCSALFIGLSLLWTGSNWPVASWLVSTDNEVEAFLFTFYLFVGVGIGVLLRQIRSLHTEAFKQRSRLQSLQSLANALIRANRDCVKLLDPEGCLELVNTAGLRLMQASSKEQLKQYDWYSQLNEHERFKLNNAWETALVEGYSEYIGRLATVKKQVRHWYIVFSPVMSESNDIKYMLVISRDITDSVNTHKSLADKNDDLSQLLDSVHGPFIGLDANQKIVYSNRLAESMLKSCEDGLIGQSLFNVLPDFLMAEVSEILNRVEQTQCQESINVYNPETDQWFCAEVSPKVKGTNLYISDITSNMVQKLELEQALVSSEMAQQMESFATWEYDLKAQRLTLSPQALALLNLTGKSRDNHFSLINRLVNENDRITFTKAFLDVAQDDRKVSLVSNLVDKNGSLMSVKIAMRSLKNGKGDVSKIIGSLQDITEQKARETYLEEAERFVRGVIDALPRQICVIKRDGTLISVNKAWMDFSGSATKDPTSNGRGQNYLTVCQTSAAAGCRDATAVYDGILDVLRGNETSFVYEYHMPINGKEHWFKVYVNPMLNSDGSLDLSLLVISHEDITHQKQLLATYQSQQSRLYLATAATNDGIWDWDFDTDVTYYSERFLELVGRKNRQLPSFKVWLSEAIKEDYLQLVNETLDDHLHNEQPFDVQCPVKINTDSEGRETRWFRLRGKAQFISGKPVRFAGSLMDIEENRQLLNLVSNRERRFREMAESIPDVFWDFDLKSQSFIYVSPAFEKVWNLSVEQANGASLDWWIGTVSELDKQRVINLYESSVQTGESGYLEYRILVNEELRWVGSRFFPVKNSFGKVVRLVGSARDITRSKGIEEKLRSVTKLDSLTKLPNRTTFMDSLYKAVSDSRINNKQYVVVFMDIDRFSQVNTVIGPQQSDLILKEISRRLQYFIEGRAILARTGGDEFALLGEIDRLDHDFEKFLSSLKCVFDSPFVVSLRPIFMTVSIGAVYWSSQHNASIENVTQAIDVALNWVKQSGGNDFRVVNVDSVTNEKLALHLESELRQALENREFELYYQPKVDCRSGQIKGCEALIRWHSESHGMISPGEFIPVLEESGLIVPVGDWVIEQAVKQLEVWQSRGKNDISIAVNISSRQLASLHFYDRVESLVKQSSISPDKLEFELTETSLMSDPQIAEELINRFKILGITIAIDDFGTGYSSLGYLKRFEPNTLKIDKCFIDEIEHDAQSLSIVEGIIELSHRLGILVVSEGVENKHQWTLLKNSGCDLLQGFYFSRPLPIADFENTHFLQKQEVS